MAVPTVVYASDALGGAAAIVFDIGEWPGGAVFAADDIIFAVVETGNQVVTISDSGGSYTQIAASGSGAVATQTATTRITVLWKRMASSTWLDATISDSGDHQVCAMICVRGCPTTGDPYELFNQFAGAISTTPAAHHDVPGDTATYTDSLLIWFLTSNVNIADQFANYACSGLTVTEQREGFTGGGSDGAVAIATAPLAAGGAFNNLTVDVAATAVSGGYVTIAALSTTSTEVGGGDVRDVTGSATLRLTGEGTTAKVAGVAGSASLSFTANGPDPVKSASAAGAAGLTFTAVADAVKVADVAGSAGLLFTATGEAEAEGAQSVTGEAGLAFSATGTAVKAGDVAGAGVLGLTATGVATKTGSAAGSAGLGFSAAGATSKVASVTGSALLSFSATGATGEQLPLGLSGVLLAHAFTTTRTTARLATVGATAALSTVTATGEIA